MLLTLFVICFGVYISNILILVGKILHVCTLHQYGDKYIQYIVITKCMLCNVYVLLQHSVTPFRLNAGHVDMYSIHNGNLMYLPLHSVQTIYITQYCNYTSIYVYVYVALSIPCKAYNFVQILWFTYTTYTTLNTYVIASNDVRVITQYTRLRYIPFHVNSIYPQVKTNQQTRTSQLMLYLWQYHVVTYRIITVEYYVRGEILLVSNYTMRGYLYDKMCAYYYFDYVRVSLTCYGLPKKVDILAR